jgi:hypothetical protein
VSPRSLATPGDWLAAGRTLISDGQIPADTSLVALGEKVGEKVGAEDEKVSTGSFYSHFSGVAEYYIALIEDWLAASLAVMAPREARQVRDPRDKLRVLRGRWAENAGSAGTMRRWAGRAGLPQGTDAAKAAAAAAKKAVGAVDREVSDQVRRALEDFGLPGEYPAVLAAFMVWSWIGLYHVAAPADVGAEVAAAAEAKAEQDFDVLIGFIDDAARRGGAGMEHAAGGEPAEVLLYLLAVNMSPAGKRELLAQAQEFVRRQGRGEPAGDPPGDGAAGADARRAAGA